MRAALAELLARAAPAATPVALGLVELQADRQFHRIPQAARQPLVEDALASGEQAARAGRAAHGTDDPQVLARRLGVRVEVVAGEGGFGSVSVFADYVKRPPCIRLYAPAIDALDRRLEAYPDRDRLAAGTRAVFLAHELFHHVEGQQPSRALAARHRVALFALGPLKPTVGLASLAEIAAGAFAQHLLSLRYHPKLLDVVALFARDPDAARHMVDRLCVAEAGGR
ncbi:hypothetical protein FHP25_10550 [Vineibacter terrae]|uniref:Uncharacterized protein n=1 Tax=Vineibacter terrae TaxID=2586908 RepID=A0A5C8PQ84_9HYPH|nr:hypothetical protein [Vineibacter terrae]TXL77194.1 hypothetical protein FHP25_10550 [Vineibacter terrae]